MDDLSKLDNLNMSLLSESDPQKIEELINQINLSIKKRNVIRTSKMNDLQDKISDQIEQRLDKRADEFSNKDLIDYYKVIQDTISKNTLELDNLKVPQIQINQNTINVENNLNNDSRKKVIEAVQQIIQNSMIKEQIEDE